MDKNKHVLSSSEKKILEDKNRFERMANTIPVMLYDSVLEPGGVSRFLYVAPGPCREILELDPEELLKDMGLVWNLIHPDDLERFQKEDLAANQAGQMFNSEVRIITPSGCLKWLLVNSKPNPAEPGEPVVWTGFLQDITERKQALQNLEETEKKLRLIVEHSTNLFFMHTPDNILTYVSPQSRQFFDCAPEEAMLRWTELITDSPLNEKGKAATQKAIESGCRQPPFHLECISRKGRKLWVEVNETPIVENGKTVAVAGSLTDVTERREAEKEKNRLARLVDVAPAAITIHDPDGKFLYANQHCVDMHGYTHEEFMGLTLRDIDVPQSTALFAERKRQIQQHGIASFEVRHLRKDGSSFPLHVSAKSAQWKNSPVVESIAVDITEQKKAEEALRQSRNLFRSVVENVPTQVFWKSTELKYLGCNTSFAKAAGFYSPEELLGKDDFQMGWHDQAEKYRADDKRVMESGIPELGIVEPQTTPAGEMITIVTSKVPLFDDENKVIGLLGIFEDITDRLKVEKELKESEYFFKESQRSASIGSYKTDLLADKWESSEVLDSIFGIGENYDRSIQRWLDLIHPDDRSMMETYLNEEVVGKGKPFAKEYRIIRQNDGETRWVYGLGALTSDSNNTELHLMGTIQDITEQKTKEEERKALEVQLQQTQKIEAVGRLAGGVAHDFNNMLSIILGHVEIAQKKETVSPALKKHLTQIHKAADRSADIVRQLLAFARKQTVAPQILDLNETIQGMVTMLRRLIGEEVELIWTKGNMLWPVKMDPGQIDQLLANLCVNARDAIDGFGTITIGVKNTTCDAFFCADHKGLVPGDYVLLAVTDTGCGIKEENLENIFEPFYTTKEVGQGTGLGLAMVYGIAKQNRGYIDVQSRQNEGTTFQVYLPRFFGKVSGDQVEKPPMQLERGQETVLLVEDEPAILDISSQLLEMQGYKVLAAETPGEAIRLAEENIGDIHLLMTDVVMPEMNGRQLAKNILTLYPNIKRLFMSGYTADVIAHHGVLDEGVHFIHKPFSLEDLATKLREVFDSSDH